jgi:hypothetical protein
LPGDIIAKLNKEINATVVDPEMKARLADLRHRACGIEEGRAAPASAAMAAVTASACRWRAAELRRSTEVV